jgi:hypothetical protein
MNTNSAKIEKWLGADTVEHLSTVMNGWYGPPIAVGNVPGKVWSHGDGDFSGPIDTSKFSSILDMMYHGFCKVSKAFKRAALKQQYKLHAGFTSLSDLIAEATAGKRYEFQFQKTGATGVVGVTNSLWGLGNQPAAGANASNAPGGGICTSATTGAFPYTNPTSGNTLHFTSGFPTASVGGNTLLLYDRLFQVNKTMNSTTSESVTGTLIRYTNTTNGTNDSAEGNFLFVEVGGTALAATAHNWTVCTYTDQSGNTGASLPSLTGNSSAIVRRLDHPTNQWFAPLASGDTGIVALTAMQCSAAVATGVINFVIGHPIAWMPCPIANMMIPTDGINSAFNLVRIFDNAALGFLEVCKSATTATTYTGTFTCVAG